MNQLQAFPTNAGKELAARILQKFYIRRTLALRRVTKNK